MFKVENEFKNANVLRSVRFTETLFERLNETAAKAAKAKEPFFKESRYETRRKE